MGSNIFLGILEAIAVGSCIWGMYHVYLDTHSLLELVYDGLWFILGFASNFLGLLSILYFYVEEDDDLPKAHWLLQKHYLFAWFTVVIGYPTFVASIWVSHYNGHYAAYISHGHVALALVPLFAWATQWENLIMIATQCTTLFAIASQGYISYVSSNMYGVYGAGVMLLNVISLSVPTRYSLLGISARETFIVGLGVCCFLFAKTVEQMVYKMLASRSLDFTVTFWEYITRRN